MKILLALAAVSLGALACSPSPYETEYGGVTGDVTDNGGNDIRFGTVLEGDTVLQSGLACDGSGQQVTLEIFLSTRAGFCAADQEGAGLAGDEVLLLAIDGTPATAGGAAPTLQAGTYAIGQSSTDANGDLFNATATVAIFDGACMQEDLFAASGSITLTGIAATGEVSGTFTANFGANDGSQAGGSFSGDFDTLLCNVTPTQFCTAPTTQCNP